MTDLFGNEVNDEPRIRRKLFSVLPHYRQSVTTQRCANCAHCQLHEVYHAKPKRWRKCGLVGGGSPETDVKARWVCDAWEKTEEAQG